IIFRLDVLHRLERSGLPITNPPSAIEKAVDKYYTLCLLEESGIPVPRTVATESPRRALQAFEELGRDVVIKPVFGSRGMGVTRVSDLEVARRIFHNLNYNRNVLYIQEFIPHGTKDIRAFVVGDRVIAAMERVAESWKTNVSQGAKPLPLKPSQELEELAAKAVKTIGCKVAGVDIIEGPGGLFVNELNSQPGFRGLQSVTKIDIAEEIVEYVIENARR
ncbi:MAG: RimK family alpha-L-glutamate ligase, partial [Nitrososphaerota archaeon]